MEVTVINVDKTKALGMPRKRWTDIVARVRICQTWRIVLFSIWFTIEKEMETICDCSDGSQQTSKLMKKKLSQSGSDRNKCYLEV